MPQSIPDPSTVIISHYQFEIGAPYQAGHLLTDAEAQALNSYRADLLRKKLTLRLGHYQKGEALLKASDLEKLQSEANEIASNFQFQLRPYFPKKSRLQLELESGGTLGQALQRLEAKLQQLDPSELGL